MKTDKQIADAAREVSGTLGSGRIGDPCEVAARLMRLEVAGWLRENADRLHHVEPEVLAQKLESVPQGGADAPLDRRLPDGAFAVSLRFPSSGPLPGPVPMAQTTCDGTYLSWLGIGADPEDRRCTEDEGCGWPGCPYVWDPGRPLGQRP